MSKRIKKADIQNGASQHSHLRVDAERLFYKKGLDPASEKDIKALFQELQIHQIELEMQNDELRVTNIELEKQRSRFSGIYNLAPVGYFILDHSGVIKDVNDTGMKLLETDKTNIIGRRFQNFIAANNTDSYYHFFMQLLNADTVRRCELEIKLADEKVFHAQVEGIGRSIPDGPVEYYIALFDISYRINAERELAETKERLELSLTASLAGTWQLDLNTMNFYLDDGSQKICNIPEGGFSGNLDDFLELVHPEDRKEVEQRFRASLVNHKEIDLISRFGNPGDKECYTVIRGHLIPSAAPHQRFVGIILDITEKTQMERSSDQLKDEYQKRIAFATLNTEENERKRISEALHDSVSQLLYGIKIQLGQLDKITPPTASNIATIKKLLDQAIEETRNISFELAPSILTDFGLSATVEELVKRLSSNNLRINVNMKGFHKRMNLLLETNIYRIIQELVNNSMKHSGASQINIELSKTKIIEIIVKDNGKGYNVKEQERSTAGSGISSIKNRLSLYNGSIVTSSEAGKGTTAHVKLYENP